VGGYRRDIANRILMQEHGVRIHAIHADAGSEEWAYVRAMPGGETASCLMSFEVGLAAYPPDALKTICEDLKLPFDAIRRRIIDLGGWVGRR